MILAGLAFLVFGFALLFKAFNAHRSGLPYVFSMWDGGLLLRGRSFRARSVLIFAVAYLVGTPAVLAAVFFGHPMRYIDSLRSHCHGALDDDDAVAAVIGHIRQKLVYDHAGHGTCTVSVNANDGSAELTLSGYGFGDLDSLRYDGKMAKLSGLGDDARAWNDGHKCTVAFTAGRTGTGRFEIMTYGKDIGDCARFVSWLQPSVPIARSLSR